MPPLIFCVRDIEKNGAWTRWQEIDMWKIDSFDSDIYKILANAMHIKTVQLVAHNGEKREYSLREKNSWE